MARKPRDFDAELQALMERAKKVKTQKTTQLGELVQVVGADTLPFEALAGALLAAVETASAQPETVRRWTEQGQAFFQSGGKRKGGAPGGAGNTKPQAPAKSGHPSPGSPQDGGHGSASDRAA